MRRPRHGFSGLVIPVLVALFAVHPVVAQSPIFPTPDAYEPKADELALIRAKRDEFAGLLERLRKLSPLDPSHPFDEFAEIAVFDKAADWIVRHGEFYRPKDVDLTLDALDQGMDRARARLDGRRPWRDEPGSHVLGYRSAIDGSIQPYAVVVPKVPRDRAERMPLDVILHGRNATLNEVRFISDHEGKPADPDVRGLVLHVFGRTNNAYRWAGEVDVFEAIAAVKRAYPVDERRIVLKGFSMGGAGAWHLGLHHPAIWCAVEAGAGFSDTKGYLRRDDFPEYQSKALHIYDALDYARNATMVPIAGYGGELDRQLAASLNIREALKSLGFRMKTEGFVTRSTSSDLEFLHVVGANTEHKVDPASAEILARFLDDHRQAGQPLEPRPFRYITYTLKYHQAPWASIERIKVHYEPATIDATLIPSEDEVRIEAGENVLVLGIDRHVGMTVRLGEQVFPLREAAGSRLPRVYFRRGEMGWIMLDYDQSRELQLNTRGEKVPGLQGPIDDAFMGPFLCVRGTGQPWNPTTQDWAEARLERFVAVWDKFLRGDLTIKQDTEVSAQDIQDHHLILFGDPGSNRLIADILDRLPLSWTRERIRLGGQSHDASSHAPVLIAPNPLAPHRYIVLNSGHTFGAAELTGTNALLYPHLGDFATFRLNSTEDEVIQSGYFDESWRHPSIP